MRGNFSIRLISINEIPEVTNWARLEGFSPGIDDLSIYRNTDKQGVWVACLDNNPIGSIACIKYNSSYGFIGLFIVKKEFRNNGYGVRLWKHALEYLKNVDCIGLEAAPDRLNDYAKWGFRKSSITNRWKLNGSQDLPLNNFYKDQFHSFKVVPGNKIWESNSPINFLINSSASGGVSAKRGPILQPCSLSSNTQGLILPNPWHIPLLSTIALTLP